MQGFQEDFEKTGLYDRWVVKGALPFSMQDGVLTLRGGQTDPNYLLYYQQSYHTMAQEVLARILIRTFEPGQGAHVGIATSASTVDGGAISFLFGEEPETGTRYLSFLDHGRGWGPRHEMDWQLNTWYWLRLRHEPSLEGPDALARIWPGDGSQPEPEEWQITYEYTPEHMIRSGLAGITGSSSGALTEFDVDYILIMAEPLPMITVEPQSVVYRPAEISMDPQSQEVDELSPVALFAVVGGNPAPSIYWYRDDVLIPGATNAELSFSAVTLEEHGKRFYVVAENTFSNHTYTVQSATAVLNVRADVLAPSILAVELVGLSQVEVFFSERVDPGSATVLSHYQITHETGVIAITAASPGSGPESVILEVEPLVEGVTYTLSVSGVMDQSAAGNVIEPGSSASFSPLLVTPVSIGSSPIEGEVLPTDGGYDIRARGNGIGGPGEQFYFAHQPRSGDFDLQVRVQSLGLTDPWAEAALVARQSETSNARFAAAAATPSITGAYFSWRADLGLGGTKSGSFPVNYPMTWLRLKRSGNEFSGFASFDGEIWRELGRATLDVPDLMLVGLAVASHDTNQATTASFRDFGEAGPDEEVVRSPNLERIGQSSRLTSLVISEIMYHPQQTADGKDLEFVEILNTLGIPEDLSGYSLAGEVNYTFPEGTVLPGGGFLVVAKDPEALQSTYQLEGVLGPYVGKLANEGGPLRLRNRQNAILLEVPYEPGFPWPVAASGAGPSLVLARPSYGEGDPTAWAASDSQGGTPGRINAIYPTPLKEVLINEILAHTDEPELDYIELYNHANEPLDVSGCYLSDSPLSTGYAIPPGTIIPAGGFLWFDQNTLGFALSAGGEGVWFKSPEGTVLDALRFGPQENSVSYGRSPDGAPSHGRLAFKTPGEPNGPPLVSDVVISEIMYHPISEDNDDEYVELHNHGASGVNLGGWQIQGGIQFTIPSGVTLGAGEYLVVARNAERLRGRHGTVAPEKFVGNFTGNLSNSGEWVALAKPESLLSTNLLGEMLTNEVQVVVDEVSYRDGGAWGRWSDGGGSSLEKLDSRSDGRLASNWGDSDETAKAGWTFVFLRGTLDNGHSSPPNQLQVLLQGAGECLIDDVQVLNANGVNVVANSSFDADATGWTAEGTQSASGWEGPGWLNNSGSYHVRAVERGDNQVNRVRTPLATIGTETATIRARVRWLKGHPEALFRFRGGTLEAVATMNIPGNLGTPGAPNSRAVANAGPAIRDAIHSPVVPRADEPVVVTAQISDPDAVRAMLHYRIDPAGEYASVVMNDAGVEGDAAPGDGLFSARVPGQSTGTLLAFYLTAEDEAGAASSFPAGAPGREGLIRFGESTPTGNFPVYRIWMTKATHDLWTARNGLDNTPLDITFVSGEGRAIYGAQALYAGSPYIVPTYNTPTGRRCGYSLSFPSDDRFLGDADLVLDWPGGHGGEYTAMQEQLGYWIAEQLDLPYCHRYTIRLHVNGVTDMQRFGVFEAVNQPAKDFLEAWNPGDDEGDFYKIDRAFEFSDWGSFIGNPPQPRLANYTTTGGEKKTARYRWNWLKRAADRVNDYTNIFELVDAVNAPGPEPYISGTESLVDIEQWMGIFAVEHIIANFDSYGHAIGKNMYAYKPRNGKWQLYMFDLDWLMIAANNFGYRANSAPLFNSEDPAIERMYTTAVFRRAYLRFVRRAVDGPLSAEVSGPVMDARHESLVANGITHCDGSALRDPSGVKQWFAERRTYLISQLNQLPSLFSVTNNNGNEITTDADTIVLGGQAPFEVVGLRVNGVQLPVHWRTTIHWHLDLKLEPGTNVYTVEGYDFSGAVIAQDQITISTSNGSVPPVVLINEWMAANSSTVLDPQTGDYDDWIELFNPGDLPVDLSGWSMSDRFDDLARRWVIPAGTSIPGGGYLLVWADEEPEQNGNGASDLHANFKLSQTGEAIALFDAYSRLVDLIEFGPQPQDASEGRLPDADERRVFFLTPTPRSPNQVPEVRLLHPIISGTGVELSWEAGGGFHYRVGYKENLSDPAWTEIEAPEGTTTNSFLSVPLTPSPQRFYRIEVVLP